MKYALPIIFALGLSNVSCGKSKKEEAVKSEEQDQNIEQSDSNVEVAIITTELAIWLWSSLITLRQNTLRVSNSIQRMGTMTVRFFIESYPVL